jgi:hypothetical protein
MAQVDGSSRTSDTLLTRLRGRSAVELADRGRQFLAALLEDAGFVAVRRPDGLDLREVHTTEAFLPGSTAIATAAALVREKWPGEAEEICRRANAALEGRFSLLGHEAMSFGNPVDWHRDPLRDKRAPRVHWRRVPFLDSKVVGDHKLVWELNRHQHLLILGQAWRLTHEERYAEGIKRHLTEWMDANPPAIGINWASSLEVGFRAISWIWTLRLVDDSPLFDDALRGRLATELFLHGHHIERYLSTYFSPNTHLTGEALALMYLGRAFNGHARARRWMDQGWSILRRELLRQVHPDGIYFERSTWYQRYTADFYLHAMLIARTEGWSPASEERERIVALVDALCAMTRPDGSIPLIGDDDGGQLLPFSTSRHSEVRATIALAGLVLQKPHYCSISGAAPASLAWLMGVSGVQAYEGMGRAAPASIRRVFPDGGMVGLRTGWTMADDLLVMTSGPTCSSGAHAHADAGSIDLTIGGDPVLVDPGTASYVQPERNLFRGAFAHSGVTIDDLPTAVPGSPFRWASITPCRLLTSSELEAPPAASLEIGADTAAGNVCHRRMVARATTGYWMIADTFETRGIRRATARFTIGGDLQAELVARDLVRLVRPGGEHVCDFLVAGHGHLELHPTRVSSCYGVWCDAVQLQAFATVDGSHALLVIVLPATALAGGPARLAARSDGRGWDLEVGSCVDTILLPTPTQAPLLSWSRRPAETTARLSESSPTPSASVT